MSWGLLGSITQFRLSGSPDLCLQWNPSFCWRFTAPPALIMPGFPEVGEGHTYLNVSGVLGTSFGSALWDFSLNALETVPHPPFFSPCFYFRISCFLTLCFHFLPRAAQGFLFYTSDCWLQETGMSSRQLKLAEGC